MLQQIIVLNILPWFFSSVIGKFSDIFRSFGDGMRDLYEKGVLRNDFILVSGSA